MTPYPPDRLAEHRALRRKLLRRYALALALAVLALAWAFGYAKGAIDGYREGLASALPRKAHKTAEICQECEKPEI